MEPHVIDSFLSLVGWTFTRFGGRGIHRWQSLISLLHCISWKVASEMQTDKGIQLLAKFAAQNHWQVAGEGIATREAEDSAGVRGAHGV